MPYFIYNDKEVFYEEHGNGKLLLLLHGNTASSKMFDIVIDLYTTSFKVILIDFLGHGKSDRLSSFAVDFWYDEAMQVVTLLKLNNYGKVNIIGTSGGALVALNVALEYPDLVEKVIADSFEGDKALDIVEELTPDDRRRSKLNLSQVDFWRRNHGDDWEVIIDNDTEVMLKHHEFVGDFFHKEISSLKVPLTASLEDEFDELADFKLTYEKFKSKISNCNVHFFQRGGHPAMLSNSKEFADIAINFFANATDHTPLIME